MTSCTWPCRPCDAAIASSASMRSAGLADADEDARGERDRQLAGGLEGGEPPFGRLVGRARCRAEVVAKGLDHHPLAGPTWRSSASSPASARRRWRGAAGRSRRGPTRQACEVVDRRVVPVRAEPRAARVAVLGRLTEGEQRLVAASCGAVGGDGQHLVGREVRRRQPRAAGRTCSSRTCRGTASSAG